MHGALLFCKVRAAECILTKSYGQDKKTKAILNGSDRNTVFLLEIVIEQPEWAMRRIAAACSEGARHARRKKEKESEHVP